MVQACIRRVRLCHRGGAASRCVVHLVHLILTQLLTSGMLHFQECACQTLGPSWTMGSCYFWASHSSALLPAVLFWLNSYYCHSVACTLLVKLYWELMVQYNFCAANMNIESQYFMDVWGGSCIMFQANWDWSAVQFGETNQKKMTRMVHSFCFHPALNMLPHHPSLASMSKCFVWQGSACHQNGCNWVLVCAYTLL